jgi:hypothetical protein
MSPLTNDELRELQEAEELCIRVLASRAMEAPRSHLVLRLIEEVKRLRVLQAIAGKKP